MIPRELTQIAAEDVSRLLEDNEPESITLEYKQILDSNQRVKLLKTVCAFANTGTGDIVVGMEEQDHYPHRLTGIAEADVENTKLKIEQWARSGIEPPTVTVRPQPVDLGNKRWALVVRVERSWAGPHRVKEDGRFHRRHSAGNCEMTIEELRRAFTEAELLAEGVRKFRADRVQRIETRSGLPVRLASTPCAVLHLLPLASIRGGFQVNIHVAYECVRDVTALRFPVRDRRYNLDGVVGMLGAAGAEPGYVQVFRTGALEAVAMLPTQPPRGQGAGYDGGIAPPETSIMPDLPTYLDLLERTRVPWPLYALVSVVHIHNYKLLVGDIDVLPGFEGEPLDRPVVCLPEVDLPRDPEEAQRALRPAFDVFWQAFGERGSPHFDDTGNYNNG